MKHHLLAVGHRLPQWAEQACADYAKRLQGTNWSLNLTVIKPEPRTSKTVPQILEAEAKRIREHLKPADYIVALDEHGRSLTSQDLSETLLHWQREAKRVVWLIGGADGLNTELKASAHACLRLSDMTLPHALARVLWVEQLYRAWSLVSGHPYHRGDV